MMYPSRCLRCSNAFYIFLKGEYVFLHVKLKRKQISSKIEKWLQILEETPRNTSFQVEVSKLGEINISFRSILFIFLPLIPERLHLHISSIESTDVPNFIF
jgi:hypothetical protein